MSNRGEASGADVERVLAGKIAEGSIVSTDRHQPYPKVLEGMGVAAHNRYDAKNRAEGDINMVNALHSRLKEFLGPFHSQPRRDRTPREFGSPVGCRSPSTAAAERRAAGAKRTPDPPMLHQILQGRKALFSFPA